MNDNVVIGVAIVLAFGCFYASQRVTGSTRIAIGVGLLVGIVLPIAINEIDS